MTKYPEEDGRENDAGQPAGFEAACSRTDAVLAVHLDGDPGDPPDEPVSGYEFVSNDSLQEHLRSCTICQSALQRARRLDAALASSAGSVVSEHVAASGLAMPELAERWLQRALATANVPVAPLAPVAAVPVGPVAAGTGPAGSGPAGTGATANPSPIELSRPWTFAAAVGLVAAGIAAWLCLVPTRVAPGGATPLERPDPSRSQPSASHANGEPAATTPETQGPETQWPKTQWPKTQWPETRMIAGTAMPRDELPRHAGTRHQATGETSVSMPLALAGQLRAARARELPEQRTVSIEELAARMADRTHTLPGRLAAAQRLLRRTRASSRTSRQATDLLLAVLAGCGDRSADEIVLHDEMLDRLRNSRALLAAIESRLRALRSPTAVRGERRGRSMLEPSVADLSTVVVAARIGSDRLDLALRRAMRRHAVLSDIVASALRCGARLDGTATLLLTAWHDQVALGRQSNTPAWAQFWFRGQTAATFDALPTVLKTTRSAAQRVSCLLALGCGGHVAAVPHLVAHLQSARRAESYAAACGLAAMPHRVLRTLLPTAALRHSNLLRAAMARAGLPEAEPWISQLALTSPQRQLLRNGPLARFPEVAAWFRNRAGVAD